MSELRLFESTHPDRAAKRRYESLVGIDDLKQRLLDELVLLLDGARLDAWRKKHHGRGLAVLELVVHKSPVVLLSGEVGCGKTALATSIGTPLATALDKRVTCLETPSDIRGFGRVGELSARITDAFSQAKARAKETGAGLLVIDEADDLATSRSEMHAHHEDWAGLNVLVKQLDSLAREKVPLVAVLITNRAAVLDAAVLRRAALHLRFERPNKEARRAIFGRLLEGTAFDARMLEGLVEASVPKVGVPYSASDLVDRLARLALRRAWREDRPFGVDVLREELAGLEPTPLVESMGW